MLLTLFVFTLIMATDLTAKRENGDNIHTCRFNMRSKAENDQEIGRQYRRLH